MKITFKDNNTIVIQKEEGENVLIEVVKDDEVIGTDVETVQTSAPAEEIVEEEDDFISEEDAAEIEAELNQISDDAIADENASAVSENSLANAVGNLPYENQ